MEQNTVPAADLNKAATEIAELQKAVTPAAPAATPETPAIDPAKLTASPSEHLFADPKSALMNDEVIAKASAPMVALAAFVAEFADGMQKAIMTINDKVDESIKIGLRHNEAFAKALTEQHELIKSFGSTPAEQFRTAVPDQAAELAKAAELANAGKKTGKEIPAQFVNDWMEKAVKSNRISAMDVARIESTGEIPDILKGEIHEAYQKVSA